MFQYTYCFDFYIYYFIEQDISLNLQKYFLFALMINICLIFIVAVNILKYNNKEWDEKLILDV